MTIFKKIRELRLYLASVDDAITCEDADRYPKIYLFMIIDAILLPLVAATGALVVLLRVMNFTRYPNHNGVLIIATSLALVWAAGVFLSAIGSFRHWGESWVNMGFVFCSIIGVLIVMVKSGFGSAIPALFYFQSFGEVIEVDILLIIAIASSLAWCLNSILMLRYKLHLYRHSFISNSNIPLR